MLWSKQFYHYVIKDWLKGDPGNPPPPSERLHGRNHEWRHLYNADVISMPDKWEYPWYAAWDLAFHCIPLALVDSDFAKGRSAVTVIARNPGHLDLFVAGSNGGVYSAYWDSASRWEERRVGKECRSRSPRYH